MNIFNIEKTEQEIKVDEIRRCAEYRRGALEAHISAYEVAFKDFWENEKVTPQEQCDALGDKASQFFQVSQLTQQYIKTLKPDWGEPKMPYEFTVNEDGTVVIGNKIDD
jgi:hypothetical protein